MSDGDYERRGPREAELRRFGRILADARRSLQDKAEMDPEKVDNALPCDAMRRGEGRSH